MQKNILLKNDNENVTKDNNKNREIIKHMIKLQENSENEKIHQN